MSHISVAEALKGIGLKTVLGFIESDPDKNLPKIMDWVDRLDADSNYQKARATVRKILATPGSNWYHLIKSFWTDIDTEVRKTLFQNFFVNAALIGGKREKLAREKYNCNIPWAILMDPTTACNLKCTGCWAADYGNKLNLNLQTLDSIIRQGKKLGVYMYIYTGGEPLVRKADLITLCEKHKDCMFLSFTNATLIDDKFVDDMLRVKNFIPAISIEGTEETTDERRGKGTYRKVVAVMEMLKKRKLPFGISCCYTRNNVSVIGSEAYIDDMIARGAKFAWFFTYMPVGVDAVPGLMATAEQREFMYRRIREYRKTKPLFTMDFWNDGEYVNGCIAGGRRYLHINANGDIEPCVFVHYSNSNIHTSKLLDALHSPIFMEYRKNQPFNENHLRPCPLLDNAGRLEQMVNASCAKSTDLQHPEDVSVLAGKCADAAANWAPVAEQLWKETPHRQ
jgi:MoaA/NifB/PqqE/SkfB family radical SAM enzyme